MDGRTTPETVDREVLTPVVRQALGSSAAEVLAWQARPCGLVFTPPRPEASIGSTALRDLRIRRCRGRWC
jgi:hypothetical protein